MRRQFIALAAVALSATLLTGVVSSAAMASTAATAKTGHERLHAVSHSATATWVRIRAFGVLQSSGHFRPRALAGGRVTERMVFHLGTFLVTMHVTHPWQSVPNPPRCKFAEHFTGTYQIHGGTGRFARAAGSGHFSLKINARLAHRDGRCTAKIAWFRQQTTTWGSLRWRR
jgi:hypothetical protein